MNDLDDRLLGQLRWNDELGSWISEIIFRPDQRIEVFVDFDPDSEVPEAALSRARRWLERVQQREPAYRRWSASRLQAGRWNKDEPMTVDEIYRLLRLATLECATDGTARLYWDDEDVLFHGHGIITRLDAAGECVEVRMQ